MRAAVEHARPGATIIIHDAQAGGVIVRVPLTIAGTGRAAEILGGSAATGIDIRADGVKVRSITLRAFSNADRSGNGAAVVLRGRNARIQHVRFVDNAFAISAIGASDSSISGVEIVSHDPNGDPIRLWHSGGVRIENSSVDGGRDVFVTWSPNVRIVHNRFAHLRYGLHDMFSPAMTVRSSLFEDCEIGTNFMYAKDLQVRGNRFIGNRGPAGYGMGLEDTDDATIADNAFVGNHVGIYAVDSPSDANGKIRLSHNLFANNGTGLALQSDAHSFAVLGNAFVGNIEQVAVSGGPSAPLVAWNTHHGGNYWSDYAGFDRYGTGLGNVAYRPQSSFESIVDQRPELQLFRFSPLAGAIDFATRALAMQSTPRLIDHYPLMRIPAGGFAEGVAVKPEASHQFSALALAMLGIAPLGVLAGLSHLLTRGRNGAVQTTMRTNGSAIEFIEVRKMYSGGRGVENISLRVETGEAVALWGPNGAGKTTLIRSLIGETAADGRISLFGTRVMHHDRRIRETIGYAPQHLPDFEMRVRDVVEMIAGLRRADLRGVTALFAELGLNACDERYIAQLSGGMRQRLCVALALIGDPPILVLDEPTAGLDRAGRKELLAVLGRRRAQGKTIFFTSHILEDIDALADRVVLLENGRIADDVRSEALLTVLAS
ncbi:MAG: NosD domain-containing protein [Vulcanimicrobiaceae bacterium]